MKPSPKTRAEIDAMRQGGKVLATILKELGEMVAPGLKPTELSAQAKKLIRSANVRSAVLGFEGYPDVLCVSVNEGLVHGIPSRRPFKEGDVVGIDLTISYRDMVVDSATTVFAGKQPPADVKRLLEGTKRALSAGIEAIHGDGTRVGDISSAIENVLKQHKLGVVRDLVGHGVGHSIHENPNIPNYGSAGTGPKLSAGMTLAIEPMATLGDWKVGMQKDGWTVVTRDGSLSAHFEHTVLITDDGAEILTLADK